MLMWLLVVVIAELSSASIRSRRQAALAVNQQEIPITLRSIISCLVPGIREYLCLGPRIEILKSEVIGLTERKGAAYGYIDGVDVRTFCRLLKPLNLPVINDKTEIGDHWGAVVDVTDRDGVVEFGERLKVFKALQLNKYVLLKHQSPSIKFSGGISEWDRQGAGVDIGSRASAADDLVKLRWTVFGINVGPTSSRTIVGPSPTTVGRAKGSVTHFIFVSGDEHKTSVQRACPWCYAVDSKYPVQQLFPSKKTVN
uniref:Peptidase S1 domain-containing protein n=1 Tax=Angiostrongylus cantonensis TaxID=6313 RepID=A0A0K0DIT7_ANGCA